MVTSTHLNHGPKASSQAYQLGSSMSAFMSASPCARAGVDGMDVVHPDRGPSPAQPRGNGAMRLAKNEREASNQVEMDLTAVTLA